jgi:hypothetical protein
MDSNVFTQMVLSSKGLLTMATAVRFLPCMNFIVFYQMFSSIEGLFAVVTAKGFFPNVS